MASVKLPETLILSITTHGEIRLKDDEVKMFHVPEGMNILKVSAVSPGVCNILSESSSERINAVIRNILGNPEIQFGDVQPIIDSIIPSLKAIQSQTSINLERSKTKNVEDLQFIVHNLKSYTSKTYKSGDEIVDKLFRRMPSEGKYSAYDYKLNLLNVSGTPDLFQILSTGTTVPLTRGTEAKTIMDISFRFIVKELEYRGVKNIVVFDFSCATMDTGDRDTRLKRRRLGTSGLNGGKRKTRRRHQKRKNSTRSWRSGSRARITSMT